MIAATAGTFSRSTRFEQLDDRVDDVLDILLGAQLIELADIRPGDKVVGLGGDEHDTLHVAALCRVLDRADDFHQFLDRLTAQRVHALASDVEPGPGDVVDVDVEAPMLQIRQFI